MLLDASARNPNDTARFLSAPANLDTGGMCLKFWYYMWGSDVKTLNIYAKQSKSCDRLLIRNPWQHDKQLTDYERLKTKERYIVGSLLGRLVFVFVLHFTHNSKFRIDLTLFRNKIFTPILDFINTPHVIGPFTSMKVVVMWSFVCSQVLDLVVWCGQRVVPRATRGRIL